MSKSNLIAQLMVPACLLAAGAFAQTNPPASNPPEVKRPPARGAWTITYQNEKEKEISKPPTEAEGGMVNLASVAPKIKKCDYTSNGNIGRCVTVFSNGTTVTAFVLGSIGVLENPSNPKDLVVSDFTSPWMAGGDFLRSYTGIEWVRPQFYRGVVKLGDTLCHLFVEDPPPPPPAPSTNAAGAMADPSILIRVGGRKAWIADDGRPLATKIGTVTATYSHKSADAVPDIQIPDQIRAKARAYLNSMAPTNLR